MTSVEAGIVNRAKTEGCGYSGRGVVCAWRVEPHSEVTGTDRAAVDA